MAATTPIASLHVLGSREFGGADQFYVRLVLALREAGRPVTAVNRRGSPVAVALSGSGVEQLHLPLANQWDLWSVLRMRRLLKARAPCVVQTYMGRATRLTRVPAGLPVVHIARLGGFYRIDGYYRHADAWVGNTRAIADYLVREGLRADRVFQIGNFVPERRSFSPVERGERRRLLDILDDARVLFALGRLIEKKGFQDLLEALARLPREISGRSWVMLIAGAGEEGQRLARQAQALGIADRVHWLGWQDPPDPWYDLADLMIVPSRHEPLGNVILEAWNYRRPVLSTQSDGAMELIRDGENGVLVPCAAPAALAAAIERLLASDEAVLAALGEAGHRDLEAHHGKAVVLSAYLDLYDRLMRERLGRG
jgi:glycosyltransferase involved in cell wall biosynthesis